MQKNRSHSESDPLWYWGILGYIAALFILPYYTIRFFTTSKYRQGIRQRITWFTEAEEEALRAKPLIWLHTVSVGELQAARPLIQKIKENYPEYKILITTVTLTGQNLAKTLDDVDLAFYLPLDLYPFCKRFFSRVSPSCLVIMETELWPNFIRAAVNFQVPIFLVNARLSDTSFRNYKLGKFLFAPLLRRLACIATQSKKDSERFLALGAPDEKITTLGNLKFEAASTKQDGSNREKWRTLFHLQDDEIVLLGGSTFAGEEKILAQITQRLQKQGIAIRLVLAPRHIDRVDAIREELLEMGCTVKQRSQLDNDLTIDNAIIVLDTIGELQRLYSAADIVFIGKSLCGRGGQNPLEASAWGKPVLFGPHVQNFRDITALLIQANAAIQVEDEHQLEEKIKELCLSADKRDAIGNNGIGTIESQQSVTKTILQILQPYVERNGV